MPGRRGNTKVRYLRKLRKKRQSKVDKLAKTVKLLNASVERDFWQTSADYSTNYGTNNVTNISDVLDAAASINTAPSGRSCQPTMLHLKGQVYNPGTAASFASCRIIVIQSVNRFVPSISSTDYNSTGSLLNWDAVQSNLTMHAPFNFNNRKHFIVKFDRTFNLGDVGVSPDNLKVDVKLPIKKKIVWDDDGAYEHGSIYLCRISSAATNAPAFRAVSTLYYRDT